MGGRVGLAAVLSLAACSFDGSGLGADGNFEEDARDARAEADAAERPSCPEPDRETVALYPFDGQLEDAAGSHHGTAGGGSLAFVDESQPCGQALEFPEQGQGWVEVADHQDWDLESGSIDFYVRVHVADPTRLSALVSRDAGGTSMPGHFEIYLLGDRSFGLRIQDGDTYLMCTNRSFEEGTWVHVGVNFGAPAVELWLNGTLVDYEGPSHESLGESCGPGPPEGIDGNDNPWVFGASISLSSEGAADDLHHHFRGGAIDHLRISSARRRFDDLGTGSRL